MECHSNSPKSDLFTLQAPPAVVSQSFDGEDVFLLDHGISREG